MNIFHLIVIFALGITGTLTAEEDEPKVSKYTVVLKSIKDNGEDVKVFQVDGGENDEQSLIRTEKIDEKPAWNIEIRNRHIKNTTTGVLELCSFLEKATGVGQEEKIFHVFLKMLGMKDARCPLEPGKSKIVPQVPLVLDPQQRPDCPSKIVAKIYDLNFNVALYFEAVYGGADGLSDACFQEKLMRPFL